MEARYMVNVPDVFDAIAAGLSTRERFALDDIAERDPRLSKPALYANARAIADALTNDKLRAQIVDLKASVAKLRAENDR
jgi:hypothetical protein